MTKLFKYYKIEKMMKNKKVLISLIILVFLTGGGFLISKSFFIFKSLEVKPSDLVSKEKEVPKEEKMVPPSEEELAVWKTYTAEQFGFEVRYPNDWTAGFGTQDFREIVILNSPPEIISTINEEAISVPKIVITLVGMKNTQGLNLQEISEAEQKRPKEEGYHLILQKDIILKNLPAKKLIFSDGKKYAIHYALLKDENIYRIIAELVEEDQKLIEIFYKILSTLKLN